MKTITKSLLWLSAIWLIVGCNNDVELENPVPEFMNITGPDGEFNDYDFKESAVTVDVKELFETEIYFRYVENDENMGSCANQNINVECWSYLLI